MSATRPWTIRPGLAPLLAGGLVLLSVIVLRILFDADEQRTVFLGHAFGWECAFRARFGVPCPNCGMTRAFVLALYGHWLRAWKVAPGGPALLACLLASTTAVFALGVVRARGSAPFAERAERYAARVILASAALALTIWFAGWIAAVAHAASLR